MSTVDNYSIIVSLSSKPEIKLIIKYSNTVTQLADGTSMKYLLKGESACYGAVKETSCVKCQRSTASTTTWVGDPYRRRDRLVMHDRLGLVQESITISLCKPVGWPLFDSSVS